MTVAVRRDRLEDKQGRRLTDFLDLDRYVVLPNTAGCSAADDAVRVALLGRDLLEKAGNKGAGWVKLEVLGDKRTLLPDPVGTLEATRELVKEGFTVLAYTSDDPRSAVRIKEAGAASVMPAASPIGSGQGVLNPLNVSLCLELLKENDPHYPVIVDAGVGTASDVAVAMELARRRRPAQHRHRPREGPREDGHGDAPRAGGGAARLSGGADAEEGYATASSPFEGVISYIPGE